MTVVADSAWSSDDVPWTSSSGSSGLALVVLSEVELRLEVVRMVLAGASVTEVAAQVGVSRQSVHAWLARYLSEGVSGLADRSCRPRSCPHQTPERVVVELRREHPRWGAKRIRLGLLRNGLPWQPDGRLAQAQAPSTSTINRILRRHGLAKARPRKRSRDSYFRFERPGPNATVGYRYCRRYHAG
ncbi:helix-turn-helix domain-containing protein [Mycobacteroides salmoniphilum]|uniref:helix-turn-helix domain-containing protein n=1 Tax=Mycobacteroides salmoniphilum TaxID=404941 RepID=UPI001AD83FB0|nr:leucine zipper domain-containing protein [Mycobacteroides salmoniphilum]